MRIQFDYAWDNDAKTVMRYSARDNWNWKDYHAVVRASLFTIQSQPHPVHTLLDFSTGSRVRFPAGIGAHSQSFGKKLSPNQSGKAVVIGVPADALAKLGLGASAVLTTPDGEVHFVQSDAEARALLANWG